MNMSKARATVFAIAIAALAFALGKLHEHWCGESGWLSKYPYACDQLLQTQQDLVDHQKTVESP